MVVYFPEYNTERNYIANLIQAMTSQQDIIIRLLKSLYNKLAETEDKDTIQMHINRLEEFSRNLKIEINQNLTYYGTLTEIVKGEINFAFIENKD